MPYTHCQRCHRELKNAHAREIGYGKVCAAKQRAADEATTGEDYADLYIDQPMTSGIILRRQPDDRLATNVPHLVTHHSPTGYEWGYGGSGPADLALNILENALHILQWKGGTTEMWRGKCFSLANRLHQDFKWEFIAPAPRSGGDHIIPWKAVASWINTRR